MNHSFDARVIAVFGRDLIVRDAGGAELRARVRGRRLNVVCGDDVVCESDATHREVNVVEGRARRTALYRSNTRGVAEPIVANISRLFVVLAPKPAPDLFVVDRYIAAATSAAIDSTLVLNKKDLPIDDELKAELEAYARAGYRTIACSARSGEGIDELLKTAANCVAALVGQSGVGKSSLVRRLIPLAEINVGELDRDEEGRHTTTTSRMFDLPLGGQLIDSPGVRDFAPAIEQLDARDLGFSDVARLAPKCRFKDCLHMREPNCAVRAAAEAEASAGARIATDAAIGGMHPRRYESYRRLRRLYDELVKARGPKYRPDSNR